MLAVQHCFHNFLNFKANYAEKYIKLPHLMIRLYTIYRNKIRLYLHLVRILKLCAISQFLELKVAKVTAKCLTSDVNVCRQFCRNINVTRLLKCRL